MARREEKCDVDVLMRECEIVLAGRYAEYLVEIGEDVPPWAWVNLLAHGSEDDLRRVLHPASRDRDDPWAPWRQARSYLAGEVLDLVRLGFCSLPELQTLLLVRLELSLLATAASSWWGPGQLVATVLAALHQPPPAGGPRA